MARTREEILMPIDWDVLDACNGLSFDMGKYGFQLIPCS